MKDLKKLENEILTNFISKRVYAEFTGDITYFLKIDSARYLLNQVYLIFSDENENQLSICLDEVEDIEVKDNFIQIEFNYNQTIKIYV